MRRDLLITALIFTVVGFVGGYLYSEGTGQGKLSPASPAAVASATAEEGLPEGHPPLDMAQRWRELEERAQQNPDDAGAAIELGNLLYDLQRWEEAATWYQRALELTPRNAEVRTDLATVQFHLGRFDEAMAGYNRALELEPNKPQALYGLALVYLHGKQDRAGAGRVYEQLRRSHPDFPGVEQLARQLEQGEGNP